MTTTDARQPMVLRPVDRLFVLLDPCNRPSGPAFFIQNLHYWVFQSLKEISGYTHLISSVEWDLILSLHSDLIDPLNSYWVVNTRRSELHGLINRSAFGQQAHQQTTNSGDLKALYCLLCTHFESRNTRNVHQASKKTPAVVQLKTANPQPSTQAKTNQERVGHNEPSPSRQLADVLLPLREEQKRLAGLSVKMTPDPQSSPLDDSESTVNHTDIHPPTDKQSVIPDPATNPPHTRDQSIQPLVKTSGGSSAPPEDRPKLGVLDSISVFNLQKKGEHHGPENTPVGSTETNVTASTHLVETLRGELAGRRRVIEGDNGGKYILFI
jgi:hypothetical protein